MKPATNGSPPIHPGKYLHEILDVQGVSAMRVSHRCKQRSAHLRPPRW